MSESVLTKELISYTNVLMARSVETLKMFARFVDGAPENRLLSRVL